MSGYRGRFAPSPTGPLHFGSLVTALASYLDARVSGGDWLVRMEDVDTPRCVPGAADSILHTLRAFGFEFAVPVVYQSERTELYRAAFERLRGDGFVYPCTCSRREVCGCRDGVTNPDKPVAWRVRAPKGEGVDDFIVLRSDELFAYQLAVVVDDADQGVTDVVRGADLLDSTPRQMLLQKMLGYPHPRYLHVPIVVNAAGEKLSKQTLAPALDLVRRGEELRAALRFLGQPEADSLEEAIARWDARMINGPRG